MLKDYKICIYNIIFFLRAITLLTPIVLLFYQYNGLTVKELFLFQGLFYLTAILAEVPIGYLANNLSRKKMLLFSFLVYLTVIFAWLNFQGLYVVLLGEICFAISKVAMDNVMSGYLYDYLESETKELKMPKYYGYLNFYLAAGTVVASVISPILYLKYSVSTILSVQILIIILALLLIWFLPDFKCLINEKNSLKESILCYYKSIKNIMNNRLLKYHIYLSGLLTACSIFFVLIFQPLIQNSFLPVYIFGVVAFLNHGIRSLSSLLCAKLSIKIKLNNFAKVSSCLYILAFILILVSNYLNNKVVTIIAIILICVIIGFQLIFTILHVSRAQALINKDFRGSLMAVNNLISRVITAVMLLASKLLINNSKSLELYCLVVLLLFACIVYYLVNKINKNEVV